MNKFSIILIVSLLVSCHCSHSTKEKTTSTINNANIIDSSYAPFSNPALIMGSTLGEIIQQYYKQASWNKLLQFISQSSIENFGKDSIIDAFQRTDFGYEIKLKSKSSINDTIGQLNYEILKFGTKGVLRMDFIIENDTAKVLIKRINPTIQFNDSNETSNPYFGC